MSDKRDAKGRNEDSKAPSQALQEDLQSHRWSRTPSVAPSPPGAIAWQRQKQESPALLQLPRLVTRGVQVIEPEVLGTLSRSGVVGAIALLDAAVLGRHANRLFADVADHTAFRVAIADRARVAPRNPSGTGRAPS